MSRDGASRGPADLGELEVLRCCIEVLDLPDLSVDDDLWALGLESLVAVELCDTFADLGLGTLEPGDLIDARTVAGISVRLGTPPVRSSTVVTFHLEGRRAPWFLVPPGGGTALAFVHFAAAIGPDRPLHVVEPRGMHRPGPVDRTIAAMADHVVTEVTARVAPGDPVRLVAYSAGVPIAHEAGRCLQAAGHPVRLAMLDATPEAPTGPAGARAPVPAAPPSPFRRATGWIGRQRRAGAFRRPLTVVGSTVRTARHRARDRRATLRLAALIADPGPPRLDPLRYRALLELALLAWADHPPAPFDTPVLWVRSEQAAGTLADPTILPDLTTVVAGRDHAAVIEPPDVTEVARAVEAFLA